jgi:hypothetical protein
VFEIHQHFEWFVIDHHQVGGIFALIGLFGDDDRNWFAHVTNATACKKRSRDAGVVRRRFGCKIE